MLFCTKIGSIILVSVGKINDSIIFVGAGKINLPLQHIFLHKNIASLMTSYSK